MESIISSVKAEMIKMRIRAILGHQENDRSRGIEVQVMAVQVIEISNGLRKVVNAMSS